MFTARSHRRLTAWIALAAMLAFALLPTLSRAMAFGGGLAGGGGGWAEICTPQGMRLVPTGDAEPAGAPAQAGIQLDHCAFCSMATDGAAPLPAVAPALHLPMNGAEPPQRFLQAAATPHAWRTAQPRGPPAAA